MTMAESILRDKSKEFAKQNKVTNNFQKLFLHFRPFSVSGIMCLLPERCAEC